MTAGKSAQTSVPVHPLIAQRWSPRGFDATHRLDEGAVVTLLEAARWAPSANNTQPWRFLVAARGDQEFDALLDALTPGNRAWAHAASALVLVAAQTLDDEGRDRPFALYDTGQAVAALTMQAQADELAIHQMGGFDASAVSEQFSLADSLRPVVVLAIGRRDPEALLPEPLAQRESGVRTREPLHALLLGDGLPAATVAA